MKHKKSNLKLGFVERNTVIDADGVVVSENLKKHNYLANNKEQFFLGYVTILSVFKKISGPSIKVYSYLLMNYNTGTMIGINMAIKQDIKKFIESKAKGVGPIDNCLSELTKEKLLFKQPDITGGYFINPRYAFKGSSRDRNSALKAVIELGCKDC